MFLTLVLLFTVIPAVELAVLIKVGAYIGVMNTLFLIVLTGVIGAYLAKLQGFFIFQKIQDELSKGQLPDEQLLDGLMILVGGIVLLTPGFITDAMGFVLLIPFTRSIIKMFLKKYFSNTINNKCTESFHAHRRTRRFDDIDLN